MSENFQPINSELFSDLSTQEQENTSGGYVFVFQKTEVATYAINEISITNSSGNNIHSRQQTGYTQSQITLAFAPLQLLNQTNQNQQSIGSWNLSHLLSIFL